jgi:hypothetical protein
MKTSISVSRDTRDHLARVAREEMDGISMDEALKIILFEREAERQAAALKADPDALAEYQHAMRGLSEQFDQVVDE